MSIPLLSSIHHKQGPRKGATTWTLSFGPDTHYDMMIEVGPNTGDVDTAKDGVLRPAAAFVLGGLDNAENAEEIEVFRCFGEDDLRWIAKACLAAAALMRRTENARRKKHRKEPPHGR